MTQPQVQIVTPRRGWNKAYSVNSTSSSFPTVAPATTNFGAPTVDGSIQNGQIPGDDNYLLLSFFGKGADNDTAAFRVYGVRQINTQRAPNVANPLYVPELILEGTCTFSTIVGVAASPVLNTERFADTIAVTTPATTARPAADYVLCNSVTANITPATVAIANRGYLNYYIVFDLTGTSTEVNALWTTY